MNKIVLVSNLKGGTGKTSICELLAIYTVEKELPCMVLDADNQLDVYEDRKDDLLKHPEASPVYDISALDVDANLPAVITKLRELDGIIYIDCPGSLDNNHLAVLYQAADAVVVPFRYERKSVRDTGKFTRIFRKLNDSAKMIFVPNLVRATSDNREAIKEARNWSYEEFGQYGYITPRIRECVHIEDCNTIALDSKQRFEVRYAFDAILEQIIK